MHKGRIFRTSCVTENGLLTQLTNWKVVWISVLLLKDGVLERHNTNACAIWILGNIVVLCNQICE